ncbi:MAG: pirin family protein [Spirochaetota bacterium]
MNHSRSIARILAGNPTREGAGVHLHRLFGYHEVPLFDPFLLFDDFSSNTPDDYLKGFPWHPHRGIETITYVLAGEVDHGDSLQNQGTIQSGDVQWMTAGSGIIHQEMPRGDEFGRMHGFQLWANLPADQKMMQPRYRDVTSEQIPEVKLNSGATVRVIAGQLEGTQGPVSDVVIQPEYFDILLPPLTEYTHSVPSGYTVFAYIINGRAWLDRELLPQGEADKIQRVYVAEPEGERVPVEAKSVVLFSDDGEQVLFSSGEKPLQVLLIAGKPIGEPVAWHGPIVMNTRDEIRTAVQELDDDTFVKHRG